MTAQRSNITEHLAVIYNIHAVNKNRTPKLLVTVTHTHYPYQNKPNIYKINTKRVLPLLRTVPFLLMTYINRMGLC